MTCIGRPFHGILSSANQSTAALIPIYEAGGDNDTITLASDEFLNVTDVVVVYAANDVVEVFMNQDLDGTSDAGETIVKGTLAANGGIAKQFLTPRVGAAGAKLYLKTGAAGQVDVVVTGFITK